MSARQATIWVDVEDFAAYFHANPRPSGIQRVAFEIMGALMAAPPGVRFVRRGGADAMLAELAWPQIQAMFAGRVRGAAPARKRLGGRAAVRRAVWRLPHPVRAPLVRAGVLQLGAVRSFRTLVQPVEPPRPVGRAAGVALQPGDWLLALGAPWAVAGFAAEVTELKARFGLRVALLLYDLVPARHPEWCTPGLVAEFDAWLDRTLPLCDRLMSISAHTGQDVAAYARERGIALAHPPVPVPMGTGFGGPARPTNPVCGLPAPGSYVLFVSTLEARKNHAFAVRVWRRLLEDVRTGRRTADSVPTLVFAGRVGWMVSDLLQQLENTGWLQGRVRLMRDPTDAELQALYAGSLFTFVPSLFEGWGLTVTESLAAGVPCLMSDRAALPEAGGAVSRYFDPEDLPGAHRAVAALLDDRAAVAAWRAEVAQAFRPTAWAETGQAVLAQLS